MRAMSRRALLRSTRWLSLAAFVSGFATSPAHAVDAPSTSPLAFERAPAALAAAAGRSELRLVTSEASVALASCSRGCAPSQILEIALPEEVRRERLKKEVLQLGGGHTALHLSWGKERAYHVFVRGGAAGGAPEVLLKGFAGGASEAVIWILGDARERTLLIGRKKAGGLCDRDGWSDVRKYDAATGRFESAQIPPFGVAERKKARPLPVVPPKTEATPPVLDASKATSATPSASSTSASGAATPTSGATPPSATPSSGSAPDAAQPSVAPSVTATERVALHFQPTNLGDAASHAWFDGDRATTNEEAWDLVVTDVPDEVTALRVEAEASDRPLWIYWQGQLHRQLLGAGTTEIALPQAKPAESIEPAEPVPAAEPKATEAPEIEPNARCLVVLADATPAPVAELRLVAELPAPTDSRSLARALDTDAGELGARVLMTRGDEAADAVVAEFSRLSAAGRKRVLALGRALPTNARVRVFVEVALHGTPGQKERAHAELLELSDVGIAVVQALAEKAPPSTETEWIDLLVALSPERAALVSMKLLDQKSSTRRARLRDRVAALAHQEGAGKVVRGALAGPELSRRSRLETLRALGADVGHFEPEATHALVLLTTNSPVKPTFTEKFFALEIALRLAPTSKEAAAWLERTAAEPSDDADAKQRGERAAWLVHFFDGVTTPGGPSAPAWTAARAVALTQDESPRVRQAAARFLGERGSAQQVSALGALLDRDEWPLVREESARAVGEWAARAELSRPLEEAVLRRLEEDPSDRVRRGAARALRAAKSEESLEALREAFAEDASKTVRGEAAVALGRRCDLESLDRLTEMAQRLASPMDEGGVELGLASLTALGHLHPADLEERVAPLTGEGVPGPLRGQVRRTLESARAFCGK